MTDGDFLGVVLEALEDRQRPFVDDDVVAQQAHFCAALDLALGDLAARDFADLRDVEHLLDRGVAEKHFAPGRREQARHRRFHFIDQVVDDVVIADFDALAVGRALGLLVGAHVEADDDGLRGARQRDVRLGNTADASMDNARQDFVGAEFLKRAYNGFDRTLHVALDDEREFLLTGCILERLHHLLERARRAR